MSFILDWGEKLYFTEQVDSVSRSNEDIFFIFRGQVEWRTKMTIRNKDNDNDNETDNNGKEIKIKELR